MVWTGFACATAFGKVVDSDQLSRKPPKSCATSLLGGSFSKMIVVCSGSLCSLFLPFRVLRHLLLQSLLVSSGWSRPVYHLLEYLQSNVIHNAKHIRPLHRQVSEEKTGHCSQVHHRSGHQPWEFCSKNDITLLIKHSLYIVPHRGMHSLTKIDHCWCFGAQSRFWSNHKTLQPQAGGCLLVIFCFQWWSLVA